MSVQPQHGSRNQEILASVPISHFEDEKKEASGALDTSTTTALHSVEYADQTKQKQSILGYFWDIADLGKEERRLLLKLDTSLLVFASVSLVSRSLPPSRTRF